MHHIQKHILKVLTYNKYATFSAMRPPKIDSNAYSYHLKVLQREGMVEKTEKGYRLSPAGLRYVDRISVEKFEPRLQPKIITMLAAERADGKILLWSKKKQPFIRAWSLPNGKMHLDDTSLVAAAQREAAEKFGTPVRDLRHRGSCLIRAYINGEMISYVFAQIFTVSLPPDAALHEDLHWFSKNERKNVRLLPATEQIIERLAEDEALFYDEFDIDW